MNKVLPETPKTTAVANSLRKEILAGNFPRDSRLPGIRKLAELFAVSYFTANLAVKQLEKEGLVERRPGSGVYVSFGPVSNGDKGPKIPTPPKRRVDELVEMLCREIAIGTYKMGQALPMMKALQFRFHTAYRSLIAALRIVEQRGLIHRSGRTYIAGLAKTDRTPLANRVYRLPTRSASGELLWGPPFNREFHLSLCKELSGRGVTFLNEHDIANQPENLGKSPRIQNLRGYVVAAQRLTWADTISPNGPMVLKREMGRLNRIGVPVVLYNCVSIAHRFPAFTFAPFHRVFALCIDGSQPGKEAGAYLAHMGHRNVAFISYSDEYWDADRFRGTKERMTEIAGTKGRLIRFNAEVDKAKIRDGQKFKGRQRRKELQKLISSWYPEIGFTTDLAHPMIMTALQQQVSRDHHDIALKPVFEEAWADKSITAWVGSDPTVAVSAQRFLAGKGLKSSQRPSIISIDDNEATADHGITACDLGRDRMGYLAAHCLLGDIPIRKDEKGFVECPVQIVERGSVARVKNQ